MVAAREQIKNSNHKRGRKRIISGLPRNRSGKPRTRTPTNRLEQEAGKSQEKIVRKIGIYWSPSLSCPPTVSGIKRSHRNGFKNGIFYWTDELWSLRAWPKWLYYPYGVGLGMLCHSWAVKGTDGIATELWEDVTWHFNGRAQLALCQNWVQINSLPFAFSFH
jgi:hypothetical protein